MLMTVTKEARMASQPIKTDSVSVYTQPMLAELSVRERIDIFGPPGLRGINPIPPSDTPLYREFQRELGLKPHQHLSHYRPKSA